MSTIAAAARQDAGEAAAAAPRAPHRLYTVARYLVAAEMFTYGFAKLFGVQFASTLSDLDTPLAQVRGQHLVWYFFGHSPEFAAFIALAEIGGGALLLFRRTTLLGALLLLPLLANVVMLDFVFGISAAATSLLLLAACVYIAGRHGGELRRVLLPAKDPVYAAPAATRVSGGGAWALRAAVLAAAILVAWTTRLARTNPTPLDGKWEMRSAARPAASRPTPSLLDSARAIYFEPDAEPYAVIRHGDRFTQARFAVDPAAHALRLELRSPHGAFDTLFTGRYTLESDRLRLTGTAGGAPLEMTLARAAVP